MDPLIVYDVYTRKRRCLGRLFTNGHIVTYVENLFFTIGDRRSSPSYPLIGGKKSFILFTTPVQNNSRF